MSSRESGEDGAHTTGIPPSYLRRLALVLPALFWTWATFIPSTGFAQATCGFPSFSCPGDQQCVVFAGECRHDPGLAGEICGLNDPCASNLVCSGGRCAARARAGQSCTGLGQGSCRAGLVCDASRVCRNDPPTRGQPCGVGVSCADGFTCSATVGGVCEAPRAAGEACQGVGQGNCASDLVCDLSGVCRNDPPTFGQPCGTGVSCTDGLACSAVVGGTCGTGSGAGERCEGLGRGSCATGLLCDVSGECRNAIPQLGEPCGAGIACDDGLACNAVVGGRCITVAEAGEACTGIGRGTCDSGLVCDVSGVCRHSPPLRGEPCGVGVACAAGLACDALVDGRCGAQATIGERCFGLGRGNCVADANCNLGSLDGELGQFCFPADTGSLSPEVCRSFYSSALSDSARTTGTAVTYGISSSVGAAASGSLGTGVVYGPQGEYGCFDTACIGAVTNVSIGTGVCFGLYNDFDSVPGDSSILVQSVSPIPAPVGPELATSQVFTPIDTPGSMLIGTEDCLSIGAGALPFDLGAYNCNTQVTVANDSDSNDDGIADADTRTLNLDPLASGGDTDRDGVPDVQEIGPDMTFPRDGDGDGVIDALERGDAAGDAAIADGVPLGGGRSVSVTTGAGELLSVVGGSPGDGSAPDEATDVYAVLGYTATAPVGGDVSVMLSFDPPLPATLSLYRVEPGGDFRRLPSSAWSRGDASTLTLSVTDGDEASDLDGAADGTVTDLIAFGTTRFDTVGGGENEGEGGEGGSGGDDDGAGSGDGAGEGGNVGVGSGAGEGGGNGSGDGAGSGDGGGGGCSIGSGQRRDPLPATLALLALCGAFRRRRSSVRPVPRHGGGPRREAPS